VARRSLRARPVAAPSGLTTGKLTTGKLSTGSLEKKQAAKEAEQELKSRTKGARLVGMVGDEKFRVTLTPVKKETKKEKEKRREEKPTSPFSTSSYSWDANPATALDIPSVPWTRRIAGICATVTNVQATGTALVLEIKPGAGNAILFRMGTGSGSSATGNLVYELQPWSLPYLSSVAFGADAVCGEIPYDLWIEPEYRIRLSWDNPTALALATIEGVVFRFEQKV